MEEKLVTLLKGIIDHNGPEYPVNNPYEVYRTVVHQEAADQKTAAALMYTLLMQIPDAAKKMKEEELVRFICIQCSLKKEMAEKLAEVYLAVYSASNQKEWESQIGAGLREFLEQEWEFQWDGTSRWNGPSVYLDCYYHAEVCVAAKAKAADDKELQAMLKKNPFLEAGTIAEHFRKSLCDCLDRDFEEFCTAEDYYEPCIDDFELEYYAKEWCQEHGFALLECEGSGDTGDYESYGGRW
ncbi:MAG: hypothetical protein IKD69_08305 [Solobacterium sp.]|nr:hypothetical protein [Solobacterium sp.]